MRSSLFMLVFCFAGAVQALPREPAVPRKWGLYIADLSNGRVRSVGDYYDWKASPDGRFIAAGRETHKDAKTPFYEISLVSTSTGKAKPLERFRLEGPGGAAFRWSSDSASVRVEADHGGDDKSEFKNFRVGRASTTHRSVHRGLALSTLKKLRSRFPSIEDIAFSPDGKRVAAYLGRGDYMQRSFDGGYWTFQPDGNDLRRLTRNTFWKRGDFDDREAVWLDGKRLAFRRTSFEDEGI